MAHIRLFDEYAASLECSRSTSIIHKRISKNNITKMDDDDKLIEKGDSNAQTHTHTLAIFCIVAIGYLNRKRPH